MKLGHSLSLSRIKDFLQGLWLLFIIMVSCSIIKMVISIRVRKAKRWEEWEEGKSSVRLLKRNVRKRGKREREVEVWKWSKIQVMPGSLSRTSSRLNSHLSRCNWKRGEGERKGIRHVKFPKLLFSKCDQIGAEWEIDRTHSTSESANILTTRWEAYGRT